MNKKGFTLVELVGVITLLGVIALIIFPAVTKTIKNSKQTAYEKQIEQIENAAKQYSTDNTRELYELDTIIYNKITLTDLINNGYLEDDGPIINPLTDEEMQGCVIVRNYEEHKQYQYNYDENCEVPIPEYVYQVMLNARKYYENNIKIATEKVNFNGATNLLQFLDGEKPEKGALYLDENGKSALAFVYDNVCYTKYFTTDYYQSSDVENCGVNTDIAITSSYVEFGGNYIDSFTDVIKTSDNGYVVIGNSNSTEINGITTYGTSINDDAIIVKYNENGNILWNKVYGGSSGDYFTDVIEEDDCYTIVGRSFSKDGDFSDMLGSSTVMHIFVLQLSKTNGEIISKKILFSSNWNAAYEQIRILKLNSSYYVFASGNNMSIDTCVANLIKYDESFNQLWIKYYNTAIAHHSRDMILTENNTLLLTGYIYGTSTSDTDEWIDIRIPSSYYTFVLEVSLEDGSLIGKVALGGSKTATPTGLTEVSDGYIIVGHNNSNDGHFLNQNKGNEDGYIAKIGKIPDSNGILPIVWIKSFGGSLSERFQRVVSKGNNIIVVGGSSSIDIDMQNVATTANDYSDGFVVKYDSEGNVLAKTAIGGSNSDSISSIALDENNFVVVGNTFSNDKHFQSFNYGNQDAFIMKLDNNLNQIQHFNLKPLLLNKLPDLIKNYGTSIPQPEDVDTLKLYTTNDPTTELGKWCSNYSILSPTSNYNAIDCLRPFNSSDQTTLSQSFVSLSNTVNISTLEENEWIVLRFHFGNAGNGHGISNLKIKFEGCDAVTIQEAVELGYIEPLVLVGSITSGSYYFSNAFNAITGGSSGTGSYPIENYMIKPRNKKLVQITFNSEKEVTNFTQGSFNVLQYHNFDISLTPAR